MNARWQMFVVFVAASLLLGLTTSGCRNSSPSDSQRAPGGHSSDEQQSTLFESVADNLQQLEQFESAQILPQIRDRLNQWVRQVNPSGAWQRDALLTTLPKDLAELPQLEVLEFGESDIGFLQETVWLRDISRHAAASGVADGEAVDNFSDLAIAEKLFDWTIRNIQLEPESRDSARHLPGEILLRGRGNAAERAWIFILLARQQKLDAVMLAISDPPSRLRPWLPAVLVDKQLYLFDTRLGLPIRGPDGKSVATLAQVASNPSLLRKLDLDAKRPYPIQPADLKNVVPLIEGSPGYLARRMEMIQSRLSGKQRLVLSADADELAHRLEADRALEKPRLWPHPYEVWLDRSQRDLEAQQRALKEMRVFDPSTPMWKARVLHFKGELDGESGAKAHYMQSRPPNSALASLKEHPESILLEMQLRLDPRRDVERAKDRVRQMDRKTRDRLASEPLRALEETKQTATFWLGLIALEQADYGVAIDYLQKRTLETSPDGPWRSAARYNLARAFEAQGDLDKAIAVYQSDDLPQSHGNKLRARQLKGRSKPARAGGI